MATSHYLTCTFENNSLGKKSLYANTNNFVCLDGPPGIGKTLISDIVTDYSCYLDEMLAREEVRTLNEYMMFVDYTTLLCNLNKRDQLLWSATATATNTGDGGAGSSTSTSANNHPHIIINRSIFSSIIYSIFFKYRGHKIKPDLFKNVIDDNIFNSPIFTKMHQYWLHILNSHTSYLSNFQYRLLWILPQNSNVIFENLKTTKFYCIHRNRIVLKYYCENLIYLYDKFAKTTNFGDILNVGSRVIRVDVDNYYKNNTDHYQYLPNQ